MNTKIRFHLVASAITAFAVFVRRNLARVCLVTLVTAFVVLPASTSQAIPIDDDLIAYYSFDGDASDRSGNGHHATAFNNYQYMDGVHSDAIRLVGRNHTGLNGGHVILPSLPFDTMPEFTISLWVNHQGQTSPLGHAESFIRYGSERQGDIVEINYVPPLPGGDVTFRVGSGSVQIPYDSEFVNNWKHLVLRADDGTLTGFVDGQAVGTDSYELNSIHDIAGLGAHWWSSGESNRFIGMIDELTIWNRALSDSEVAAIPEPTTLALATLGLIGLAARRRRRLGMSPPRAARSRNRH